MKEDRFGEDGGGRERATESGGERYTRTTCMDGDQVVWYLQVAHPVGVCGYVDGTSRSATSYIVTTSGLPAECVYVGDTRYVPGFKK